MLKQKTKLVRPGEQLKTTLTQIIYDFYAGFTGGREENSVATDTHALVLWALIYTEQTSATLAQKMMW